MKMFFRSLAFFILVLLSFSCTTRKIYHPEKFEIKSGLSADEVTEKVMISVKGQGWEYLLIKPGVVMATWNWKGRNSLVAVMEIVFDEHEIFIKYGNSRGLKYNGQKVHRRFNYEVKNLEQSLRASLSATPVSH